MANDYEVLVGVKVNETALDSLEKRINDIESKEIDLKINPKGDFSKKLYGIEKSLKNISSIAGATDKNVEEIGKANMKTLLSSLNQISDALGTINKEGGSNTVLSNFDAISSSISKATEEIKEFLAAYGSMSSLGNVDLSSLLTKENVAHLANVINELNASGGNNSVSGAKKAATDAVETAVENNVADIAERAFGNAASKKMTVPIPSSSAKKISLKGRSTLLGDTVTTKKSGMREATVAISDSDKTAMVDAASSWLDDVGGLISTNIEGLTNKQRRDLADSLAKAKEQISDVTRSLGQDDVDKKIEEVSKERHAAGTEKSRIRSAKSKETIGTEKEHLQREFEKQQQRENELLVEEIRMRQLDLAKRHNTIRENVSAIRTNTGDMSRAQYEMLSSIVPPSVVPNVNRINYVKQGIKPSYSIGATGLELIEYYKEPMIRSLADMFLKGDEDRFSKALYSIASNTSSTRNKSNGQKEFADFIKDITIARKEGISNQEEYDYTGYITRELIDNIVKNGSEDVRFTVANNVARMVIEDILDETKLTQLPRTSIGEIGDEVHTADRRMESMRMLAKNGITLKDVFKNIPQEVVDREDAKIRRRNTPSTIAEDVVFDPTGNTPEFSNAKDLAYNAMYTLAGFRGMIKDGKFVGVSKNKGGDTITPSYRVPTTSEFATALKHFFWNTPLGAKGNEREIGNDFIKRVEQAEMRQDKDDPVYSELYQYMVNNERRIVGEKRLGRNNVLRNRRFPEGQRLSQSKLGVQKISDERLERIRRLESVFASGILDEAELPSVDVGVPKDNLRNRFKNLVKTMAYQSGMVAANEDYSFDKYFKEFFSDVEGILLDDTGRVATSFNDILDDNGKINFDKQQNSVLANVNRLDKQGWAANHTIYGQLIERGLNMARDMGIDVSEFYDMPKIYTQDVTPQKRTTIGQRLDQLSDEELVALEEKAARINVEKEAEKEAKKQASIDRQKAKQLREEKISQYQKQIRTANTTLDNNAAMKTIFKELDGDESLIRNVLRYAGGSKLEAHKSLSSAMRGNDDAYLSLVKNVLDGAAKQGVDTSKAKVMFAKEQAARTKRQEIERKNAELEQKIEQVRSASDDEILGRTASADASGQDKKVEIETNAQEVASDAQQMQSSMDEVKSSANAAGDAASEAGNKINNSFDSSKPVSDLQAIVNAINEVVIAIRELSTVDIGNMFSAYANAGGDVKELANAMGIVSGEAEDVAVKTEGAVQATKELGAALDKVESAPFKHSRPDVYGNQKIAPVLTADMTNDEISAIIKNNPSLAATPDNIRTVFTRAVNKKDSAAKLKAEDVVKYSQEIDTENKQAEEALTEAYELFDKYKANNEAKIAAKQAEINKLKTENKNDVADDSANGAADYLDRVDKRNEQIKNLEAEIEAVENEQRQLETHMQQVLAKSSRQLEIYDAQFKDNAVASLEKDYERLNELERKKYAIDETDSKAREKIEAERKEVADRIKATERSLGISKKSKENNDYGVLGKKIKDNEYETALGKRYDAASSKEKIEEARQLGKRDKAFEKTIKDLKLISDNKVKMAALEEGSERYEALKKENENARKRVSRRKGQYDFTEDQEREIKAIKEEGLDKVDYADKAAYDKKREKALTKRLAIEREIAKAQADMVKQEEGTPLYEDAKKKLEYNEELRRGYDSIYGWTTEQQKRISEEVTKSGAKVNTAQAKKDQDEIKSNFKELLEIEKKINDTELNLDVADSERQFDLRDTYAKDLEKLKARREELKDIFGISETSPRGTLTDSQYEEYKSKLGDVNTNRTEAAAKKIKTKRTEASKDIISSINDEFDELYENEKRIGQIKIDLLDTNKSVDEVQMLNNELDELIAKQGKLKTKLGLSGDLSDGYSGWLTDEQVDKYQKLVNDNGTKFDNAEYDQRENNLQSLIRLEKEAYKLRKERVNASGEELSDIERRLTETKQRIFENESLLGLNSDDIAKAIEDPSLFRTLNKGLLSDEQFDRYTTELYDMASALNTVEAAYRDAQRVMRQQLTTGVESLTESFNVWETENTKAMKMSKWASQMQNFRYRLSTTNDLDQLKQINKEFDIFKKKVRAAGDAGLSVGDKLRVKMKEYASYAVASMGIMEVVQGLRQIAQEVLAVDTAMTELRRVTDLTAEGYDNLYQKMSEAAIKNGRVLSDSISATADWVRAGFDAEVSVKLAEKTAMYQNVSDLDYDEAMENMLTSYNGFKQQFLENFGGDEAAAAEHIVDVLNELDNNFSVTSAGLGEGLARSASALQMAGNTFEQSAA